MKERPNILFLMTDEQRYDAAGWVNSQVHTPVLNRLAGESVWVSRAYTTNPSCIPARAAVFTGRYPSQCGVPGYASCLPKRETTFMKYLQDGGYYTAVIGKQHFWRSEIERGYDYEDIVDEHEPPAVISKELPEGAFGLPANKTVSDRVSSYVEFLADSDFTSGSQLYREINSKGIYEFTGEEKYHVAMMDFGVKQHMIECLRRRGCKVTAVPAFTKAEELLGGKTFEAGHQSVYVDYVKVTPDNVKDFQ